MKTQLLWIYHRIFNHFVICYFTAGKNSINFHYILTGIECACLGICVIPTNMFGKTSTIFVVVLIATSAYSYTRRQVFTDLIKITMYIERIIINYVPRTYHSNVVMYVWFRDYYVDIFRIPYLPLTATFYYFLITPLHNVDLLSTVSANVPPLNFAPAAVPRKHWRYRCYYLQRKKVLQALLVTPW